MIMKTIYLPRSMANTDWLFENSRRVHLWLLILFRIRRTPGTFPMKDRILNLQVGQFVGTVRTIAAELHSDKSTVSRDIQAFECQGWLRREDIGNRSLFTVLRREYLENEVDETPLRQNVATDSASSSSAPTDNILYKREKEYYNKIYADTEFQREVFQELRAGVNEIARRLPIFEKYQAERPLDKDRYHSTYEGFKKHFKNWLKKIIQNEIENERIKSNINKRTDNPVSGSSQKARGSGFGTPACGLRER